MKYEGEDMLRSDVLPLVLGTAHFGTNIPRDVSFEIMDTYFGCGGNVFDTAAVYGMGVSEQTLGDWLKSRKARSKVIISTKGGHPSLPDWKKRISEAEIRSDIESSLRYLGTDYVDTYFLHRDDEALPVEVIMPILDKLVREGKTRYIGASNWKVSRINEANAFARANGMTEFAVSQIYWCGAIINADGVQDKTLVLMDDAEHAGYAENGMPVMAYTSQAKGFFSVVREKGYDELSERMKNTYVNDATKARAERIFAVADETGISPTAVSLAYLLYDKDVKAYPILGTSRPERVLEAVRVFDLNEEHIKKLF
ncbi:MAG: aldo/keto reductase [Ruminococcaceae bacterium]|nr:aldo/keto reductase [Oscillospiraceae bacterium]